MNCVNRASTATTSRIATLHSTRTTIGLPRTTSRHSAGTAGTHSTNSAAAHTTPSTAVTGPGRPVSASTISTTGTRMPTTNTAYIAA